MWQSSKERARKREQKLVARAKVATVKAQQLSQQAAKREQKAVAECSAALRRSEDGKAHLFANQAVRNRVASLRHANIAMQLETFEGRLAEAAQNDYIGETMRGAVRHLEPSLTPAAAARHAHTMQAFETQMEHMGVMQVGTEAAMQVQGDAAADDVEVLLQSLRDDKSLEAIHRLPLSIESQNAAAVTDLEARIHELRS